MAATPIDLVSRFIRTETSKFVLCDRIASTSGAATRAEIDAGVDITDDLATVEGFQESTNFLDTPDFGSLTTTSIVGRSPSISGTFTMYGDATGGDIREQVTRLDEKTLIVMDNGDTPTDPMDVFNIVVGAVAPTYDGDNPMMVAVSASVAGIFLSQTIPS